MTLSLPIICRCRMDAQLHRKHSKLTCSMQKTLVTTAPLLLKALTCLSFASGAYVHVLDPDVMGFKGEIAPHTVSLGAGPKAACDLNQQRLALTSCSTLCQAQGAGRAYQEHAAQRRPLGLCCTHPGNAPQ